MTAPLAPLVPAYLDLRDFRYMPLDVVRLRDSDLVANDSPEAFQWAVLAWCVAWHQVPAASLPDDDKKLSRLLGFGRDIAGWQAARAAGALHGFLKCDDGRLYHPVVAEKAIEAWQAKQRQRARTAAATAARAGRQRPTGGEGGGGHGATISGDDENRRGHDDEQRDAHSDVQRNVHQGKGREEKGKGIENKRSNTPRLSRKRPRAREETENLFNEFWGIYPKKADKGHARKAYFSALAKASPEQILDALKRQLPELREREKRFQPGAATWLNGERWLDETQPGPSSNGTNGPEKPKYAWAEPGLARPSPAKNGTADEEPELPIPRGTGAREGAQ